MKASVENVEQVAGSMKAKFCSQKLSPLVYNQPTGAWFWEGEMSS